MKKIRKTLSLCLLIIVLTNTVVFANININDNIKGALLGDLETGQVLYEYNINQQLAIASISKLMTYTVMMDKVSQGEISLDDDVVISGHAAATEGSNFGLLSGETIKLRTLVNGMLIISGNDCATAIAEHVGKTQDNFVSMMNAKASELGLLSASFINPHGLPINDEETGQNYMSVSDLFKMVRYVLNTYPEILEITKQPELIIVERNFRRAATNPILGVVEGADGLKTGYTDKAGIIRNNHNGTYRAPSVYVDGQPVFFVFHHETHHETGRKGPAKGSRCRRCCIVVASCFFHCISRPYHKKSEGLFLIHRSNHVIHCFIPSC
jgi:D-alanyl-D-alanine carboxypeptidase (penicillin-binding protein 5/6)